MRDSNRTTNRHLEEHAERNLSALVIAIEFTLISVMVGVILFPLMDNALPLLKDLQYQYWLYILSGLLFILYLWTEVITHSLSFIGWPIHIGHNLLYIVLALTLGIQMHLLSDPRGWYVLSLVNAVVATVLVYFDKMAIEERMAGAEGSAATLFGAALNRQRGLLGTGPFNIANAVLDVVLVVALPGIFVQQSWHIVLVLVQIIALSILTYRTINNFTSWRLPIVDKAMEELLTEGEK